MFIYLPQVSCWLCLAQCIYVLFLGGRVAVLPPASKLPKHISLCSCLVINASSPFGKIKCSCVCMGRAMVPCFDKEKLLESCRHRGRQVNPTHTGHVGLPAIPRASLWEWRWLCLQLTHPPLPCLRLGGPPVSRAVPTGGVGSIVPREAAPPPGGSGS